MTEITSEAVEADDFLQIYEAFEDATRKIQIPLRYRCAIRKVVWSSFDYMTGPELGFTWEAGTVATSSSNKSSLSGSSRDGSSLTSSVTTRCDAADYEEIDDIYQNELLTEAVSNVQVCAMCMRTHSGGDLVCDRCNLASGLPYDAFKMNVRTDGDERIYLDEFMNESRSTVDGTTTTTTLTEGDNEHSRHLASLTSLSISNDFQSVTNSDKDKKVILSQDFAVYKANSSASKQATTAIHTETMAEDGESLSPDEKSAKNNEESQAMFSSGVDSGIAGTVSMHSDLSTVACPHEKEMSYGNGNEEIVRHSDVVTDNNVDESCMKENEHTVVAEYDENAEYEALCDLAGDSVTMNLSDEEFVAKFVLAEQICSTPMPSNPVMHKLTLLPKRHLFVGSYLFQAKDGVRHDRAMYAISLLGDYSRWEWYTEKQNIIEEAFIDIIPRLRISYLTERIEDFICRATKEISKLLSIFGVCEVYPLLLQSTDHDIRLRQTYFGDGKLQDNLFLAKAITAVLLSQSHCVIVGDVKNDVVKMLLTLFLFVAPEWRWLCIRPYKHPYSPYFRLQAIQRVELISVMYAGAESHWPLAIIDLDRRIVCSSSPHPKHRTLKLLKQKSDISQILKGAGVDSSNSKMPKIELRNCQADPRVRDFLMKMDLLPFESSVRLGFIRQFRLVLENSARALIAYVDEISKPNSSYKRHAISSKWNLWSARKSLDLTSTSSFLVTLSEAERILPEIADFIFESETI